MTQRQLPLHTPHSSIGGGPHHASLCAQLTGSPPPSVSPSQLLITPYAAWGLVSLVTLSFLGLLSCRNVSSLQERMSQLGRNSHVMLFLSLRHSQRWHHLLELNRHTYNQEPSPGRHPYLTQIVVPVIPGQSPKPGLTHQDGVLWKQESYILSSNTGCKVPRGALSCARG